MFTLEVEFLLGRAFGGDFRDQTAPEWPPHPGRLFSALAAAYFENGANAREKEALEWLEQQPPPQIRAGEAGVPTLTQAFVPTNYIGDGPPVTRGKQPRYFPAQGPSEATVHFIWPQSSPSEEVAGAIDDLAGRLAYLGKACSVIRARVRGEAPTPNYTPDSSGAYLLRTPSRGRLEELAWLFSADRRPSAGTQQRYRRTDQEGLPEPKESEFGAMAVFRKVAGPGLPIEAALTLTECVRAALMKNAERYGPIPELLHGHEHDTHCAIAALPFVGREHADGHLLGFAVIFPRGADAQARRDVLACCADLEANGLNMKDIGLWTLEAADAAAIMHNLRPATWAQPSKEWRSVTPILLDRFAKKKGPTVPEILAESCKRIGLPEPTRIEHGPYSEVRGVPPVPAFRLRREKDRQPRWGVHATLEFAAPVRGPILLGAGRYFGLGLMRPWREEKSGGN